MKERIDVIASEESFHKLSSFTEIEEYNQARKAANSANRKIHRENPEFKGKQIHEIHPVRYGGSPTDLANKIPLSPPEHYQYNNYWNRLMRELKKIKENE
ncbi:hypothetical protein COE15_05615 [Bacillus cereus]|uniref:hypothetical protein n=1 Tax=Bacillus sp. AFS023182 TaxID=2033492 RepID=UPI000BF5542A|nr:hypothetical protein [Bacillus sp. AFS023182]PFE05273.1 hypothetical protein CN288_04900 [Bacillus sp. AFS023182]PGY03790.1 hypothetical protein COE15_05615 [Bacillus cereus]